MRVLAAVDGSPASIAAAGYGALLARASRGSLVLAYALEDLPPPEEGREPTGELAHLAWHAAREALALAADYIRPIVGDAEQRFLYGAPAEAIVAEGGTGGYDLIAMGTYGAGQGLLSRLFAGGTALAVLGEAPAPVLLVPGPAADTAHLPAVRSLLVPTDGSLASLDAAELAAEIAAGMGATVLVLHCAPEAIPEGFAALALTAEEREQLARGQEPITRLILRATQEPFLRRGMAVDAADVEGSPAAEILRAARDGVFSLIVMGSYGAGESILKRARLGSVAEAVVAGAPCPVIIHKRPLARDGG